MSLTVWLLANPKWGGDVAAIIVIPINVAAVLVPLLPLITAAASRNREESARGPGRVRRRRLRIAVAFTLTVLLVVSGVTLLNREEDPLDYLAGTLRVGVVGENYPGWNEEVVGAGRVGFDVALVEFIKEQYPAITDVDYVKLTRREDRVTALTDDAEDPVDLVVANFSITPKREELIDFAGPYYYDSQGFFTWEQKSNIEEVPVDEVCLASGTTGSDRLTELGWQPVIEKSLVKCMEDFLQNEGTGRAVSTDTSILQAFAEDRKQDKAGDWQRANNIELGQESYGVGIPNNRPRLCEELNRTITQFINDHWTVEFNEHLKGVTDREKHMPKSTTPCKRSTFFS
ncbi:transporter substrate-binding domain-containing protein [Saccharothrix sp. HUAS TT1]|uniref:transporter substrate-binding domain-containing protein n=1 Tax=unclassified Saccharothrix TaxID=2593673 RepID=UPI00345C117C